MKKLFALIKESLYHKKDGKISSGRLSSYFILFVIILSNIAFISIDISNAFVAIHSKGFFEIPSNHIVLYGMTLAHHLALLGINKTTEASIERAVQNGQKAPTPPPPTPPDEDFKEEDMI